MEEGKVDCCSQSHFNVSKHWKPRRQSQISAIDLSEGLVKSTAKKKKESCSSAHIVY